MAWNYNYGMPMGYQPPTYPAYQDRLAQLTQPQPFVPQPMPQGQANNGIIWVQGEAGAKSYIVNQGNSVVLFDSEDKLFYIKSVDGSGIPSLRTFKFDEVTADQPKQETPLSAPAQAPAENYVTREEYETVAEQCRKMADEPTRLMEAGRSLAEEYKRLSAENDKIMTAIRKFAEKKGAGNNAEPTV